MSARGSTTIVKRIKIPYCSSWTWRSVNSNKKSTITEADLHIKVDRISFAKQCGNTNLLVIIQAPAINNCHIVHRVSSDAKSKQRFGSVLSRVTKSSAT